MQQTYRVFGARQRIILLLSFCLIGLFVINIILDYLFTRYQNSSFYISESLLFSSFWILFLPLLNILSKLAIGKNNMWLNLVVIISFVAIHLIAYPAMVWLLSKIFYDHTFSYFQTFNYGLSTYLIKTIIIYPFCLVAFANSKNKAAEKRITVDEAFKNLEYLSSIIVSDNRKKMVLAVNDIFYFSASSPYINIHCATKNYLCTDTMKNLEDRLDDSQFVRIHKSHILNIGKVDSFKSRKNGDYDVTLLDDEILRVSRSYANVFKTTFYNHHRLTAK
ncbi:MAG: LytTR family transcriptional regulator [Flavobacterium sp.]|nr:MAG: LytTR family transcriptional regulator [Flavobacterium sp.]